MCEQEWEKQKPLGSGGFGTVDLWKNKITTQLIAVKRCRPDLSPSNLERWEKEVEIMKRLQHPYVVSAWGVPLGLPGGVLGLPSLAMEYCDGGDLRKVLNDPKNCCGLPENIVLNIAQNIASAIEFLRGERIIHRDIKPENIVILRSGEKSSYKLADLGYAKQLDQNSIANSFVGTLQYLAPELLANEDYTRTVDFWSFGTVIFECITGRRPFLPDTPVVQWHREVLKKKPNDICTCYDKKGAVKFSSALPSPNFLKRPIQVKFVEWLRLMFRWNARERGGRMCVDKRLECFHMLDDILSTRLVNIFCIRTGKLYSYEVSAQQSILELQEGVSQDSGIPVCDQRYLCATGDVPDTSSDLQSWCCEAGDQDKVVFLYSTNEQSLDKTNTITLPQTIQMLVSEETSMPKVYKEKKSMWACAVHFTREQTNVYKRLVCFHKAARVNVLRLNSLLTGLQLKLNAQIQRLEAKMEFFVSSFQTDIDSLQNSSISVNKKQQTRWRTLEASVTKNSKDTSSCKDSEDRIKELQARVHDLQKSPAAVSSQILKNMDILTEQAVKCFESFCKRCRENDLEAVPESFSMKKVIVNYNSHMTQNCRLLYDHLRKILKCKEEQNILLPQVEAAIKELVNKQAFIESVQKQRQVDIWKILDKNKTMLSSSDSGLSHSLSSSSSCTSSASLSDIHEQSQNRSLPLLRSVSHDTANRLLHVVRDMKLEHSRFLQEAKFLDWNFAHEDTVDSGSESSTFEPQAAHSYSEPDLVSCSTSIQPCQTRCGDKTVCLVARGPPGTCVIENTNMGILSNKGPPAGIRINNSNVSEKKDMSETHGLPPGDDKLYDPCQTYSIKDPSSSMVKSVNSSSKMNYNHAEPDQTHSITELSSDLAVTPLEMCLNPNFSPQTLVETDNKDERIFPHGKSSIDADQVNLQTLIDELPYSCSAVGTSDAVTHSSSDQSIDSQDSNTTICDNNAVASTCDLSPDNEHTPCESNPLLDISPLDLSSDELSISSDDSDSESASSLENTTNDIISC